MLDDLAGIAVIRVARAELPVGVTDGVLPCTFCAGDYLVHKGWLVDYYHAPTRRTARSYVCQFCAARAQQALDGARPAN